MRTYLTLLALTLAVSSVLAQDPGMQAAQAAQQAAQISQQASQQAIDQMNQASQQANQQAMQNAQQAALNTPQCYRCVAAKPSSREAGRVFRGHQAKDEGLDRGAVIYYTTDGWTPTAASTRYTGPIAIDSTTSLQAIAISPYGGRSRVATAVYTLNGVAPTAPVAQTANALPISSAPPSAPDKVVLPEARLSLS